MCVWEGFILLPSSPPPFLSSPLGTTVLCRVQFSSVGGVPVRLMITHIQPLPARTFVSASLLFAESFEPSRVPRTVRHVSFGASYIAGLA